MTHDEVTESSQRRQPAQSVSREELFISYAVEDAAFVRWLALKLSASGYRVWWDRDRLHGGGAFPTEIDEAIKLRAVRVLAVLSHHSAHKANPERERSIALSIARDRKEDFLIPLNLELKATELPWMMANLTFVPFMDSWAAGLRQLLEDLRHAGVPCFPDESSSLVRNNLEQPSFVVDATENVWANLFPIADLPVGMSRYEWREDILDEALRGWAHHREGARACWAFEAPPDIPRSAKPARDQYAFSTSTPRFGGINMNHVATSLLRQYVEQRCRDRALIELADTRLFCFPSALPMASHFAFALPNGRATWTRLVGTRRIWQSGRPEEVRCHLAFNFRVELTRFASPFLQIRPTLHFTTLEGLAVDSARNVRRAKAVRRAWFNDKWLARVAAIGSYLADGAASWRLHPSLATTVAGVPLQLTSSPSLDEAARAASLSVDEPDDADEAADELELHLEDEGTLDVDD